MTATVPTSTRGVRRPQRRTRGRGPAAVIPLLFLAPALILLAVFVFYPLASAFFMSLTNWNGISSNFDLVGVANYLRLFVDPDFMRAAGATLLYTALTLPPSLVLAFFAALAVARHSRSSTVLRVSMAVPFVVSIAVVSAVWMWILEPNFGLVNYLAPLVGLPQQNWLGDPNWAMFAVAIPSVWRQFGYFMLILLAGIHSIDPALHEAARLDGASSAQRAWHVTLPLLGPQLYFCLVLGVIDSFQVFAQVHIMTSGGPQNATSVVVYELYQQSFEFFNTGYASAIAIVLLLVIGTVTFIQQRWLGSRVFYQ
ncbi:carbohydrate ABC transporter permease [Microcella indica]|uniref:carbohydrate ABC transporter permease n=1 Tax=Microcella indica TaxID=2750620 RepID=UPI0015CF1DDF|nr:sugar ABC transporter permease [Microcella indica]